MYIISIYIYIFIGENKIPTCNNRATATAVAASNLKRPYSEVALPILQAASKRQNVIFQTFFLTFLIAAQF